MTFKIFSIISLVLGLNVAAWFFQPESSNNLPVLELALEAIDADQGDRSFELTTFATEHGADARWLLERSSEGLTLSAAQIKAMAVDGRFTPVQGDGPKMRYRFTSEKVQLGDQTLEGTLVGELVIDPHTFSLEQIHLESSPEPGEPQRVTAISL